MGEAFLHDLFAAAGPITVRHMFGGQGVYLDGRIVAVVLRGEVLLKGDAETAPLFEAAGSRQWTYERPGRAPAAMPYFTLPTEAYDDPEAMALWAKRAQAAALRAPRPAKRVRARSQSA